ncbi:MAG: hypothetical protein HW403_65 [Dehalococcoidia bacterium]|nr:hypothetical protein [Dehalococcoidia bacterium]
MNKLTVTLKHEYVYKALAETAQKRGIPVEVMAVEVLEDWYDDLFLMEDLTTHKEALAEYKEKGGIDAAEYFRQRIEVNRR